MHERLVVADDDVIAEVACFDEFGGYISVGSTWFGVVGWVVGDDHDRICVGEEGTSFVDFVYYWNYLRISSKLLLKQIPRRCLRRRASLSAGNDQFISKNPEYCMSATGIDNG